MADTNTPQITPEKQKEIAQLLARQIKGKKQQQEKRHGKMIKAIGTFLQGSSLGAEMKAIGSETQDTGSIGETLEKRNSARKSARGLGEIYLPAGKPVGYMGSDEEAIADYSKNNDIENEDNDQTQDSANGPTKKGKPDEQDQQTAQDEQKVPPEKEKDTQRELSSMKKDSNGKEEDQTHDSANAPTKKGKPEEQDPQTAQDGQKVPPEKEKDTERELASIKKDSNGKADTKESTTEKRDKSTETQTDASPVNMGGKITTGKILNFAWLNILDSIFLTLIYIDFHFIMRYIANVQFFSKFGEEWTPKGATGGATEQLGNKGGNATEQTASSAVEWAEIILMFLCNSLVAIIITIIFYAAYYISNLSLWQKIQYAISNL